MKRPALALGLLLAATSLPVAAQQSGNNETGAPRPPVPSDTDEPPVVMNILTLAIMVALVVGVQAIPSKRGHQD